VTLLPTVPSAQTTDVRPVTTLGQHRPETRFFIALFKDILAKMFWFILFLLMKYNFFSGVVAFGFSYFLR
jgi:hypothetical protein